MYNLKMWKICLNCGGGILHQGHQRNEFVVEHSDDSSTFAQHDQCRLPGCPSWP